MSDTQPLTYIPNLVSQCVGKRRADETGVVESLWQLRTSSLLASNIMQQARGGGIPARLAEHGDILEALSRNDPTGAKAAMQKHLENVRQYLLDATEIEEMESLRNRQMAARAAMTVRSVY